MGFLAQIFIMACLFGIPPLGIHLLQRRYQAPKTLIPLGILLFIVGVLLRIALLGGLLGTWADSAVIGGVLVGLVTGMVHSLVFFVGLHYFGREVIYRHQAVLVGLGFGLLPVYLKGLALVLDLASRLYNRTTIPTPSAVSLGADVVVSLAPLVFYALTSWLILQVFLRQQVFWLFVAAIMNAVVAGTEHFILFGSYRPDGFLLGWWLIIALVSALLLVQIRPPSGFVWSDLSQANPP
jgi:hypothetical protein